MSTALQVGSLIGGGRLATVHRASLQGRVVAVKRARAGVPGAVAALRREARVLTAAAHPAIVPVLGSLDDPVAPALVLGWADGGSLGDLLADGPISTADLLHLLRPLAGGLEALHAAGVAHLDVSAGNVLLAAAGPILIDPAPPGAGTPGFTDPVVAAGGPASPRSDVYGLAACAHLALTGRLPRTTGGVAVGLMLPEAVRGALAVGLHPESRWRPASPSAFVDRLGEALGAGPPAPGAQAGVAGNRAFGRPVVRTASPRAAAARTWPFDRWQEEAAAAAERQAAIARLVGVTAPPNRKAAAPPPLWACWWPPPGWSRPSARRSARSGCPRTSAPDSTRRPPGTRPQPPTTPGVNP